MKMKNMLLPLVGLMGALLLPLGAQAKPMMSHSHSIYQRLHNQRARIRSGARHRMLPHREAMRLEHKTARIQRKAARDRYMHGGRLTRTERRHLAKKLNKTSKAIHREKHEAAKGHMDKH